jgi:hypothetical protein
MQHAIPEGRSGYRLRTTCSRIARIHQNRLVEFVNPSGSQYQDTLKQMTDYFLAHGSSFAQAPQQAFTWTSQQVQLQASYLAYIDVFWLLSAAQDQLQKKPAGVLLDGDFRYDLSEIHVISPSITELPAFGFAIICYLGNSTVAASRR